MLKTIILSNAGYSYTKKELENVEVSSERNIISNFKSITFEKAFELETKIKDCLSERFKDFSYKILVTADETKKDVAIRKTIVLLQDYEMIDCVMDYLTGKFRNYNIEFDLFKEEPKDIEITDFEETCQFWANNIQNYFANEFGFDGTTKIKAAAWNNNLLSIDISASGKGVNDNLINGLKKLSKNINNTIFWQFEKDDIFLKLEEVFKS